MFKLTVDAFITLGVILLIIVALFTNRVLPDLPMAGGLVLLVFTGVLDPRDAFIGFSNPAVLMIGALFVVGAALRETGGVAIFSRIILGVPKRLEIGLARLCIPVALLSAFMNTTPIVAMYINQVSKWSKSIKQPLSLFLMPLSFAGILGAQLTIIGTASNLVVFGQWKDFISERNSEDNWLVKFDLSESLIGFWSPASLGIPVLIIGIIYLIFCTRWILPSKKNKSLDINNKRSYEHRFVVRLQSGLAGKTIVEAGLRHLPDLYLHRIERDDKELLAVNPREYLREKDVLVFVGAANSLQSLQSFPGLALEEESEIEAVEVKRFKRRHLEAVVSNNSSLVGKTIREAKFRTNFNAAIVGVSRGGDVIAGKIGDIRLRAGDVLLIETGEEFLDQWGSSNEFHLVSHVGYSRPVKVFQASISVLILLGMVLFLITGFFNRIVVVWGAALAMVLFRCIDGNIARRSIDWTVLIVIACAIGIGKAVDLSGLAGVIVNLMISFINDFNLGPQSMIALFFLLTTLLAQLITNNGAAVMMFPIAILLAERSEVSPLPFIMTLMVAAGCSFLTPIGYQTNLMVYGPGGYTFSDYLKFGIPLTLLIGVIVTIVAPIVWPFV